MSTLQLGVKLKNFLFTYRQHFFLVLMFFFPYQTVWPKIILFAKIKTCIMQCFLTFRVGILVTYYTLHFYNSPTNMLWA